MADPYLEWLKKQYPDQAKKLAWKDTLKAKPQPTHLPSPQIGPLPLPDTIGVQQPPATQYSSPRGPAPRPLPPRKVSPRGPAPRPRLVPGTKPYVPPWAGIPPYARWGEQPTGKSYTVPQTGRAPFITGPLITKGPKDPLTGVPGWRFHTENINLESIVSALMGSVRSQQVYQEAGAEATGEFVKALIPSFEPQDPRYREGPWTIRTPGMGEWISKHISPGATIHTPAPTPASEDTVPDWVGGYSPVPEDPYEIFAPHTKAYLERGIRPSFVPYGSQEVLGLTDEQMGKMGYIRGENGWILPTTGTPEATTIGTGYTGAYPAYQPIQINYPGVSSTRAASGRSYGLVNWRV